MELNEPDWISLEPSNHSVFSTLLSLLECASSDSADVQQLVDSTTATLLSEGTRDPDVDRYRLESRMLFGILFTIIKQLSPATSHQDHLIALALSLRHVPLPESITEEIDPRALDSDMNHDLSKLRNVFADLEFDAPLHPRLRDRDDFDYRSKQYSPWREDPGHYLTGQQWANINAFMAKLHVAAPDVMHLDLRGLFAMIEALEQPLTPSQLEDVLPAAAYWIIYAGKELHENDMPYPDYDRDPPSKRHPWSRGELWTGRRAFNQGRWEFWMERFKVIAERRDVSESLKLIARHAYKAGSSRI